jgi:hypothetical protein
MTAGNRRRDGHAVRLLFKALSAAKGAQEGKGLCKGPTVLTVAVLLLHETIIAFILTNFSMFREAGETGVLL